MELSNLQADMRTWMNDPDGNWLTEAKMNDWLNDAQTEIAAEKELLISTLTLSTDGTAYINLTTGLSSFMMMVHLFYNNEEIFYLHPKELTQMNNRWYSETGTPTNYTLIGDYLWLYPYTSASSNILTGLYLKIPTAMSNMNDIPWDGVARYTPMHRLVSLKACMLAVPERQDTKRYAWLQNEYVDLEEKTAKIWEAPDRGHAQQNSRAAAYRY